MKVHCIVINNVLFSRQTDKQINLLCLLPEGKLQKVPWKKYRFLKFETHAIEAYRT